MGVASVGLSVSIVGVEVEGAVPAEVSSVGVGGAAKLVVGGASVVADVVSTVVVLDMELELSIYALEPRYFTGVMM